MISAISEKSAFSTWPTTSLHTFIFPLLWETGYHRNRDISISQLSEGVKGPDLV